MSRPKQRLRTGAAAAILVATTAVSAAGCGGGGSSRPKAKVITEQGGAVAVTKNQPFVIQLESNPSTGYTWALVGKPSSDAVKFIKSTAVKPQSGAAGAPGKQNLRFRAVTSGTATVTVRYARPSDPSAAGARTLSYQVTVG